MALVTQQQPGGQPVQASAPPQQSSVLVAAGGNNNCSGSGLPSELAKRQNDNKDDEVESNEDEDNPTTGGSCTCSSSSKGTLDNVTEPDDARDRGDIKDVVGRSLVLDVDANEWVVEGKEAANNAAIKKRPMTEVKAKETPDDGSCKEVLNNQLVLDVNTNEWVIKDANLEEVLVSPIDAVKLDTKHVTRQNSRNLEDPTSDDAKNLDDITNNDKVSDSGWAQDDSRINHLLQNNKATAAAAVRKHSEGSTLRSQGGGGSSTGSRKTSTISTNRQISWGDVSSMGESSPDLKIFTITDFTTLESKQKYEPCSDCLEEENGEDAVDAKFSNGQASHLAPDTKIDRDAASLSSLKRSSSRSSIASTFGGLKDKIVSSMPSEITKKPEETRLRIFVVILFCLCAGLVISSHVLYQHHVDEIRLFPRVKLDETDRRIVLYDKQNKLVLSAQLGLSIPHNIQPYHCVPLVVNATIQDKANEKCIEWKDHARLIIKREEVGELSCHRLAWQALSASSSPLDCWPVGDEAGHWYGGGERLVSRYPLDNGQIRLSPFVTGDEDQTEWGNVIRKFFINSRGLSISIEKDTPLSISFNDPSSNLTGFCLRGNYDEFPYYYHRDALPQLNYTVCTDGNLVQLYDNQLKRSFWNGHTDADLQELSRLLKMPLWQVPGLSKEESGAFQLDHVANYINTIRPNLSLAESAGSVSRGYLLLDHRWQENMGDIKLADSLRGLNDLVEKSGLTLVLTLNPFVSTDSDSFREGLDKHIFVMERNSSKHVPALTWFKDAPAAALLDVTNNKTVDWMNVKLAQAASQFKNVVFFLDTGNTFHTPHYFKFQKDLSNPDLYKEYFISKCMRTVKVIGVSGASSTRPKAPAFVHLTPVNSSWEGLRTIIPNVLNLGVIGYPFISPGPVGGNSSPPLELYIRWWQLNTFLPQLHFTTPPSTYRELNISAIARSLKWIKEAVVNPQLIEFGREAMEWSQPVIRPLWMLDPTDLVAQQIDDQFLIGNKVLVAPVVRQGAVTRDVYLPGTAAGRGVWKRGTDGAFFEGGRWLNGSDAPLDTVLYFVKLPDDARPGP